MLRQLLVSPVLAHLGMQKILINGRQFRFQHLVQDRDDFGITFHSSPRSSTYVRGHPAFKYLRANRATEKYSTWDLAERKTKRQVRKPCRESYRRRRLPQQRPDHSRLPEPEPLAGAWRRHRVHGCADSTAPVPGDPPRPACHTPFAGSFLLPARWFRRALRFPCFSFPASRRRQ